MFITLDTFLISDTHFGHTRVLQKEPSRITSATKNGFTNFDDFAIHSWNKVIGKDTHILHLGDLYFDNAFNKLLSLNGKKMLVIGNNDINTYKFVKELDDWKVCAKLKIKTDDKEKIKAKMSAKFGKEWKKHPHLNAIICEIEGERIMFSHFPVMNRKANDRFAYARDLLDSAYRFAECSLNIHGHLHSRDSGNNFCINVSCEKIDFIPRTLGEILAFYKNRR